MLKKFILVAASVLALGACAKKTVETPSEADAFDAAVKGLTLAEARALHARVHALLTGQADASDPALLAELGKVAALAGVREYPSRVKCATLAWHTLLAALDGAAAPVSTE